MYVISAAELDQQLAAIEKHFDLPLYGVPFAVKDNIDVAGIPTTAACPAFGYVPSTDAASVARLRAAGAIVMGKTNLDQFATGLVGTRSPFGTVSNAFNDRYISGGSSSGSASVVARGLVPFSLGTDTAGSGRVPAGFNNIVGLKPTKGRISTRGVVPACRSLDCVSVFALTLADADTVADLLSGFDADDAYSRTAPVAVRHFPAKPRLGIPLAPEWFGDTASAKAWEEILDAVQKLGAEVVPVDFTPMFELARLLYGGPWVAERYAAVGDFMSAHAEDMNPVVRGIIEQATRFSATDAFRAEYRRAELVRTIQTRMATVDALLVPTAPRLPTIEQVEADPVAVNSQLGTYTNFVNLADCAALALPASIRADGLPFGITLIAPAWQDSALVELGQRWLNSRKLYLGATKRPAPLVQPRPEPPRGHIRLAVVGAHLSGMPLNYQLTERHARLVETTFTSADYRLYALPNTTPPKPGLVRGGEGAEIVVELWDIPVNEFGSFVALVPAPLGIGTLTLHDNRQVKGFICEGSALEGARDISEFGGWRAYLQSLQH
ncbi:MAG: allophanate hydrolase [Cellvibrionaceae bacterium]|nr:allophanate hydrolase [Cellvibrionaceae bacterium]